MNKAEKKHLKEIQKIIHENILKQFVFYYPKGVIDFLINYHNEENLQKDLKNIYILEKNNEIIGTGSINNENITRVFIKMKFQQKGYGNIIMDYLESIIKNNHQYVLVESSFPGYFFYQKRGYEVIKHEHYQTESKDIFCYDIMKKNLT